MTHPARERVERANWWREHLRDRCRQVGPMNAAQRVLIRRVQEEVARYYGMTVKQLLAEGRARDVARPRQIAMFLSRRLTTPARSFPDIGKRFGGLDHTTVVYAVKAVDRLIDADPEVRNDVDCLMRRLGHGR